MAATTRPSSVRRAEARRLGPFVVSPLTHTSWQAFKQPEGSDRVVYSVQRKLINKIALRLIGGSGEKAYQDDMLPVGIDGATYVITAKRGNVQGQPSRQLTVKFDSGGPGAMRFGFAEANATTKKAA